MLTVDVYNLNIASVSKSYMCVMPLARGLGEVGWKLTHLHNWWGKNSMFIM